MRKDERSSASWPYPEEGRLLMEHDILENKLKGRRSVQLWATIAGVIGAVVAAVTGNGIYFAAFSGCGAVVLVIYRFTMGKGDMGTLQSLRTVEHQLHHTLVEPARAQAAYDAHHQNPTPKTI